MSNQIKKEFFQRESDIVARELLGKILIRDINGKQKKGMIVETEAYHDESDPASRASKGENKVSKMMKQDAGKILVYNVHKYKMLNFVADKKGKAGAVLIRAIEPLNFEERCNGPGLLTLALEIREELHGKDIGEEIIILDNKEDSFEIVESFRIGVTKDLKEPLRFYIKDNKHISRK